MAHVAVPEDEVGVRFDHFERVFTAAGNGHGVGMVRLKTSGAIGGI